MKILIADDTDSVRYALRMALEYLGHEVVGFAIDEGDDDFAGFGVVLGADDDEIAFADAGVDHRVAMDLEGEDFLARKFLGQIEGAFDVFLGKQRAAGGDAAKDRHGRELGAEDFRPIVRDESARFARQFFEVAFCFQRAEVIAGGAGGAIAERAADFADGGRAAGAADAIEDVRQQFLLSRGQRLLHEERCTTQACGVPRKNF